MATQHKQTLFYKDKPLFGLDIGFNTIKVMQIDEDAKHHTLKGYGVSRFDSSAIKDGVIVDYELLAKAAMELFDKGVIGKITSRRVAATIPASRAYSRVMTVPASLNKHELEDAIHFEAEQYIPIPIDDLYLDYMTHPKNAEQTDVLVVAVPKKVVDSYMKFFNILGLEVCALETTISAASRIIAVAENSSDIPTILIDLGSLSVDLTVFDEILIVNGTIPGGGDDFSNRIAEKLNIEKAEANSLKTKYGLGVSKRQPEIRDALKPQLDSLIKEIRRVVRYYEERTEGKQSIGQIITMGGGANMPGLVDYMTDNLRIPTRLCNFWGYFDLKKLQPPHEAEQTLYVTVAGAAIVEPKEIWL
ncbi:type IV pilus assembly protein PilM [Candidatus Saccharibacteria bacterium]|nr:type IV pilus assembly protein PilM [Candidatus Saccharibacteria bacterium]